MALEARTSILQGDSIMLYVYKCDHCGSERAVIHRMDEEPAIRCAECDNEMRIKIVPGTYVITSTVGNRSILKRDTPSNREYRAYKNWEDAGGAADAPERQRYLEERGYD